MTVHGLIIDPQEDFCNPATGTLYVPGAEKDMERLAGLVRRIGDRVSAIHVTLDSHHHLHIAHPVWWVDTAGRHPDPFTIITVADVISGRWRAAHPEAQERSRAYVQALAQHGRYPLCIWPYHCLIGSHGHAVAPVLFAALTEWEAGFRAVDHVMKGSNIWTEHYSAIRADVPDPSDPSTHPNRRLLDSLEAADVIFVAGEASSHCVANTVRDLAEEMGEEAFLRKLVLLTDATSAVRGFEANAEEFVQKMTARGMQTATTAEFLR
jgi:nicotinamidase-related amidase